jgi:hypothetical protein
MTPKEKAEELFDKFRVKVLDRDGTSAMNGFEAKQCALIAVDEILLITRESYDIDHINWWQEVKTEIEKL